jgi:uncharacterized protein YjbJ (UPF0337 family)
VSFAESKEVESPEAQSRILRAHLCWRMLSILHLDTDLALVDLAPEPDKLRRSVGAVTSIGQLKETAGSLTGSKALKAAGQSDKAKGALKKKGAAKDLLN